MGLVRKSSHPAARAFSSSPLMACAVSATMGMCAVAGLALMRRVASHPLMSGNDKSIKITSGLSPEAFVTPASRAPRP